MPRRFFQLRFADAKESWQQTTGEWRPLAFCGAGRACQGKMRPSSGRGNTMAKVQCIFQFTNLGPVGIELVDEFLRQHPEIRSVGSGPGVRAMEWFTQKERGLLIELASEVETRDPEKAS
jgi:hypothetical protein